MLTIADEGGRGVSEMLTIADEGGRAREFFYKMDLKVPKLCVKETK